MSKLLRQLLVKRILYPTKNLFMLLEVVPDSMELLGVVCKEFTSLLFWQILNSLRKMFQVLRKL